MRKVILLLAMVLACKCACFAADNADELLKLVKMGPESITQAQVVSMFGKPVRVEESRKAVKWYYSTNNADMVINWSTRSGLMQKFAYNYKNCIASTFDINVERKLRSGMLDISNAMKLLGTPKDMLVKESTQIMHYAYQNNVLRLFFRNGSLVDYTLVESKARS